jgi:hypothetical protein
VGSLRAPDVPREAQRKAHVLSPAAQPDECVIAIARPEAPAEPGAWTLGFGWSPANRASRRHKEHDDDLMLAMMWQGS